MIVQHEEIRVNQHYSTLSIAEYPGRESEDSTPIINKRRLRTTELLTKIRQNVVVKNEYKVDHLFPPNCRYYEQYKEGHLIVIEEPPAFRTIAVDKDMSNELECLRSNGKLEEYGYENWAMENSRPYMFTLAMPYSIFILAFNEKFDPLGGMFFFRTSPISGFNDALCKAPFLNINDGQTVCFGDIMYKGPKRSIFSDTNFAISTFWSTIFNPDYIYNYHAYQEVAGLCDYFTWQHYSNEDPMFIYKADWINYDRYNIGTALDYTRGWIFSNSERTSQSFGYLTLSNLFNEQSARGKENIPGIDIEEPLIYDVCQYIYLDDLLLNVGDSFKVKNGKQLFVDSFLGFRNMTSPTYINIEREDGKLFRWRIHPKGLEYIKERLKEERFEASAELDNGVTLKAGDILVMKNRHGHEVYRKIHYLRKNTEGDVEGRFGSEYYITNNLPNDVKILDLQNPEYMGMSLNKDDEYFVLRNSSYPSSPNLAVSFAKFRHISTGSRGNLIMEFKESQGENVGYNHRFPFKGENQQKVFGIKELRKLPPVFRFGNRMMYCRAGRRRDDGDYEPSTAYVIPNHGVATGYNTSLREAHYSMFKEKLIKDDKLKIESWDMDIEFSIGDKVVVANWKEPAEMLSVKRIDGFVEAKDEGKISMMLSDKNGILSTHLYVDGKNGIVNVGSIRKITNQCGELSAGMKIIAEESGISMFPKKDCNIIIGFIYDTGGEPLVLCSNACTLWYSDVETKFKKITMKNMKPQIITHLHPYSTNITHNNKK